MLRALPVHISKRPSHREGSSAGMQHFYAKGRLLFWTAVGAALPLLLAAVANFVWVLVVETDSAGDAWWIVVLIVLPIVAVLLAAIVPLQLALSVSYFSQAQALRMHADSLRHSLKRHRE